MRLHKTAFITVAIVLALAGCSKKTHPATDTGSKPAAIKTPVAKKVKIPTPKIITVDDRAAKRTPDGRLYYDFDGKRYWRNYDDGKYYLYNKSMYNNPSFKPH
jgi:hypothetical protein